MKSHPVKHFFTTLIFFLFLFNIAHAQWTQTNGPYTGDLPLVGSHKNCFFAFTAQSRLYRSNDLGATWKMKSTGLVVASTNPTFCENGQFIWLPESEYFSSDTGNTWVANNIPISYATNEGTIMGNDLYAATEGKGVYKSVNNGVTWVQSSTGIGNQKIRGICNDGANLFCANDSGRVFTSNNNGTNWSPVGFFNDSIYNLVYHKGNLYAVTEWNGALKSIDGGVTWNYINTGLSITNLNGMWADTSGLWITSSTSGTFNVSYDEGANWTNVFSLYNARYFLSGARIGTTLIGGTKQRGIVLSTDSGTNWTISNTGLCGSYFSEIVVNGSYIFAGTSGQWPYVSADTGATWTFAGSGLAYGFHYTTCMEAVAGAVFIGSIGGVNNGISKTINNGVTWTNANGNLSGVYPNDMQAGTGNELFITEPGSGAYVTTNLGVTWNTINNGLPSTTVNGLGYSDGVVYVGTNSGVYFSRNSGANWQLRSLSGTNISMIKVSGKYAYSYGSGGLRVSQDTGYTWTNAPVIGGYAITDIYVSGHSVFLTTSSNGVFMSTNGGLSWTSINTGLPSGFSANAIGGSNDLVFLGVTDYGVWKRGKNSAITGNVFSTQGTVANGFAKLYSLTRGQHILYPDSVAIINGVYQFNNVIPDDYFVMANGQQTFPLTIPTYHDSAYYWDSSIVISSLIDTLIARDIYLVDNFPLAGAGFISGNLSEGPGYQKMITGFTPMGQPVSDIGISLGKKPSGHHLAHTITDAAGNYSFSNVPPGNYYIYVDVPGLPMDTLLSVTINGSDTVTGNDFVADSTHIYLEAVSGLPKALNSYEISLSVYPNPSPDIFNLKINVSRASSLSLEFTDLNGRSYGKKNLGNLTKGMNNLNWQPSTEEKKAGVGLLKIFDSGKLLRVIKVVMSEN